MMDLSQGRLEGLFRKIRTHCIDDSYKSDLSRGGVPHASAKQLLVQLQKPFQWDFDQSTLPILMRRVLKCWKAMNNLVTLILPINSSTR